MKLDFYINKENKEDIKKIKEGFDKLRGNFSGFVVYSIKKCFINGDWSKFILGGKDEGKEMRKIKINKIN